MHVAGHSTRPRHRRCGAISPRRGFRPEAQYLRPSQMPPGGVPAAGCTIRTPARRKSAANILLARPRARSPTATGIEVPRATSASPAISVRARDRFLEPERSCGSNAFASRSHGPALLNCPCVPKRRSARIAHRLAGSFRRTAPERLMSRSRGRMAAADRVGRRRPGSNFSRRTSPPAKTGGGGLGLGQRLDPEAAPHRPRALRHFRGKGRYRRAACRSSARPESAQTGRSRIFARGCPSRPSRAPRRRRRPWDRAAG